MNAMEVKDALLDYAASSLWTRRRRRAALRALRRVRGTIAKNPRAFWSVVLGTAAAVGVAYYLRQRFNADLENEYTDDDLVFEAGAERITAGEFPEQAARERMPMMDW
jgi:hypothetical protein